MARVYEAGVHAVMFITQHMGRARSTANTRVRGGGGLRDVNSQVPARGEHN